MITYRTNTCAPVLNLLRFQGSVFPKAFCTAIPIAIFCGLFPMMERELEWDNFLSQFQEKSGALSSFSSVLGFLVVFRATQAYARFWEGITSIYKMGAEWFDATAALVSFLVYSDADESAKEEFKNTLVRLTSLLHATALGEISDTGADPYKYLDAFDLEVLGTDQLDDETHALVRESDTRVELTFQLLMVLIVDAIRKKVLSIPPPILTRVFQELNAGMVEYHDALKISNVPLPFPYTQTCDMLLLLQALIMPFIVVTSNGHWMASALLGFISSFSLHSINYIAMELENPFGSDANDMEAWFMQMELNKRLLLLLNPKSAKVPRSRDSADPWGHNMAMLTLKKKWTQDSNAKIGIATQLGRDLPQMSTFSEIEVKRKHFKTGSAHPHGFHEESRRVHLQRLETKSLDLDGHNLAASEPQPKFSANTPAAPLLAPAPPAPAASAACTAQTEQYLSHISRQLDDLLTLGTQFAQTNAPTIRDVDPPSAWSRRPDAGDSRVKSVASQAKTTWPHCGTVCEAPRGNLEYTRPARPVPPLV
eukprot:TRINITY_DN23872_c0_g1_i1.p1 TRINITY_DN23872_c0_g1~~TRINITY_DN23872_c0_g1_i1.p1  ORF type:complete len:537 (-),score=91.22 TRINITY_DN23872_c0_g1_i1:85-1695(-)